MSLGDMVDIYVNGRLWTRMPCDQFEAENAAAQPAREAMQRELLALWEDLDRDLHRQQMMNVEHGWLTVIL